MQDLLSCQKYLSEIGTQRIYLHYVANDEIHEWLCVILKFAAHFFLFMYMELTMHSIGNVVQIKMQYNTKCIHQ